MDTTQQFNLDLGTITMSAIMIEKVHRCADCPIRKLAVKQPKSIFAKMHTWHKTWWPGWKAHQARTCALSTKATTQA
jgi:hypothetical protein